MSKFFTPMMGLGLAALGLALGSEMMPSIPTAGLAGSSGSGLPAGLQIDRFSALGKKSPFTLASATEEMVDFAKDLYLGSYFRVDGKDFIIVGNRSSPGRITVGTVPPKDAGGLVLVKIERDPSGDPKKLRAKVRKGGEIATLKYEEAGVSPTSALPVAGAVSPVAGQPTPNPSPVPGSPQAIPPVPGQAATLNPPVTRRRITPVPGIPGR